jgi:hypothetical protein
MPRHRSAQRARQHLADIGSRARLSSRASENNRFCNLLICSPMVVDQDGVGRLGGFLAQKPLAAVPRRLCFQRIDALAHAARPRLGPCARAGQAASDDGCGATAADSRQATGMPG